MRRICLLFKARQASLDGKERMGQEEMEGITKAELKPKLHPFLKIQQLRVMQTKHMLSGIPVSQVLGYQATAVLLCRTVLFCFFENFGEVSMFW